MSMTLPPVTPADSLDGLALARLMPTVVRVQPEVPLRAPAADVKPTGRRRAPGSRLRLAYLFRPAARGALR